MRAEGEEEEGEGRNEGEVVEQEPADGIPRALMHGVDDGGIAFVIGPGDIAIQAAALDGCRGPLRTMFDQSDYLETLSELAEAYESANHESLPALPPHEFLAAHLGNIGMTATEWGKLIGIDRSTASRLLRGERKFNTAHVRKTSEALGLEPSLLI